MTEPIPIKRPIRWEALRCDEAEAEIKRRAAVTKNVKMRGHPVEQEEDRSTLNDVETYRVLRNGMVLETPKKNQDGNWEAVIEMEIRNSRDVAVVTIIFKDSDKLVVKTVMWRD